jgi:hypothetical protein
LVAVRVEGWGGGSQDGAIEDDEDLKLCDAVLLATDPHSRDSRAGTRPRPLALPHARVHVRPHSLIPAPDLFRAAGCVGALQAEPSCSKRR